MSKKRKLETEASLLPKMLCNAPNGVCRYGSCKDIGCCQVAPGEIPDDESDNLLGGILEATQPNEPIEADIVAAEDALVEPVEPEVIALPNTLHAHRESWLHDVAARLAGHLFEPEFDVPTNVRISCGFPSRNGLLGGKSLRSGETWGEDRSEDGHFEIFISPTIDDPINVIGILAHELCHTVAGIQAKHGSEFKKVADHIGLTGKMTETKMGTEFRDYACDIIEAIGPYPMAKLDARKMSNGVKKQGTRLLKAECPVCGFTVRIAKKWVDDVGIPHCPQHGEMAMPDIGNENISE